MLFLLYKFANVLNEYAETMQPKQDRLKKIRDIIASNKVNNQDSILEKLAEEGYVITQATLSRDLKILKVSKTPDGVGGYHYVLPEMRLISDLMTNHAVAFGSDTVSCVKSIEFSGQMCVLKTNPGYANMIGSLVDNALSHKLMGTIAGDDTLLLIMRVRTDVNDILADLETILPGISARRI